MLVFLFWQLGTAVQVDPGRAGAGHTRHALSHLLARPLAAVMVKKGRRKMWHAGKVIWVNADTRCVWVDGLRCRGGCQASHCASAMHCLPSHVRLILFLLTRMLTLSSVSLQETQVYD